MNVAVTEEDELMLMTSTGQSIRIRVNEIRETGRVAQGVKLLTLKEGEKLQDIALVIPDGEDSDGTPDGAPDGAPDGTPDGTPDGAPASAGNEGDSDHAEDAG